MGTLGEKMSGIGMTSTRTRNRMVDRLRAEGMTFECERVANESGFLLEAGQ